MPNHVDSDAQMTDPAQQVKAAFQKNDVGRVAELLGEHPSLRARINDSAFASGSTALLCAAQRGWREMIDVLLRHGADIDARTDWWAGGFGVLDNADAGLAAFLIERGAKVDVHAAARLGMLDTLKHLLSADPELVHARGGDGKTPLHCASTAEVADYLLGQGADLDARDIDHESTPAQHMVRSRPAVAKYLVSRGCRTDILMATALGDTGRVRQHLDADPSSVRMRVSNEYFPMVREKGGGTIYQWELGWYVSAHQVARTLGHESIYQLLMERTPADERLLAACWLRDASLVESLLNEHPNLASELTPAARRHAAHAARNNDVPAALLMLRAGFPLDGRSQHGGMALHWAAWHGRAELVEAILGHAPPLEDAHNDFQSTPLGWAIHGSEHGWARDGGDYPAVVELLCAAGAKPPATADGTPPVKAVLRAHSVRD